MKLGREDEIMRHVAEFNELPENTRFDMDVVWKKMELILQRKEVKIRVIKLYITVLLLSVLICLSQQWGQDLFQLIKTILQQTFITGGYAALGSMAGDITGKIKLPYLVMYRVI